MKQKHTIVMLPIDRKSSIIETRHGRLLFEQSCLDDTFTYQEIYVLSDDKLEDDDIIYELASKKVGRYYCDIENKTHDIIINNKVFPFNTSEYFKKVIATTERICIRDSGWDESKDDFLPQIPKEFIKEYRDSYNSRPFKQDVISEVKVEYLEFEKAIDNNAEILQYKKIYFPKLNSLNEISISKVEDKLYTKEEVISFLKDFRNGLLKVNQREIDITNNYIKEHL